MSISRRSFVAALALSPLLAEAAKKKAAAAPVGSCSKSDISNRPQGDVICDLETGDIIHLSDNLVGRDLSEIEMNPASLTKLESAKQSMRNIWSGLWTPETEFKVSTRGGTKPRSFPVVDNILMSLGPSLNVMDDVARQSPTFMKDMAAYMKSIGMEHTTYVSPTGNPDNPKHYPGVRTDHKTTIGDILLSIRDFELKYATPEVAQKTLGRERISGIWKTIVRDQIHRSQHPISILEDAEGGKAHPYPGVRSGKSGYTCNAGFISYVRYDEPVGGRSFIVLTLGHPLAATRDKHTAALIDTHKPAMEAYGVAHQVAVPDTGLPLHTAHTPAATPP